MDRSTLDNTLVVHDPIPYQAKKRKPSSHARCVNRLLKRDGEKCFYCGIAFAASILPTIEHRIPRCNGGSDKVDNLVLACYECNHHKGNLSEEVFVAGQWLAGRRAKVVRIRRAQKKTGDGAI